MRDGDVLAGPRGTARRRRWPEILRFGMAGLVNTLFGYAVFAALLLLGAGPLAALVLATVAGVAFNFQTSRRFVFRAGGPGHTGRTGRWLRFVAVYGAVLALNWAALRGLQGIGLPGLWAQAILALPVAALSFTGQKLFVFGTAPGPA